LQHRLKLSSLELTRYVIHEIEPNEFLSDSQRNNSGLMLAGFCSQDPQNVQRGDGAHTVQ
jgi:hypothetical protein